MQPSMMIARDFYCHPYMLPTIFIKIKISVAKFALAKKKKIPNFPSHFWHICKVCNSFFYMVENCATFQKKKEALPSKRKTSFKCFFNPLFSSLIPSLGTLQKSRNRG
jgi:hypothetical protein